MRLSATEASKDGRPPPVRGNKPWSAHLVDILFPILVGKRRRVDRPDDQVDLFRVLLVDQEELSRAYARGQVRRMRGGEMSMDGEVGRGVWRVSHGGDGNSLVSPANAELPTSEQSPGMIKGSLTQRTFVEPPSPTRPRYIHLGLLPRIPFFLPMRLLLVSISLGLASLVQPRFFPPVALVPGRIDPRGRSEGSVVGPLFGAREGAEGSGGRS